MPANQRMDPLTVEFLAWLASPTRTYAETMEAWRTSCPRHPVWEDAFASGLIQVQGGTWTVVLTTLGRRVLEESLGSSRTS
jgi:hypothetical protein